VWYLQLEVTFEEARAHLGMRRSASGRTLRTTVALLGCAC
jgi:hypothetical protein